MGGGNDGGGGVMAVAIVAKEGGNEAGGWRQDRGSGSCGSQGRNEVGNMSEGGVEGYWW